MAIAYAGLVIEQRAFGRIGRTVGALGVGTWGMGGGVGGWTGSDDRESTAVLQAAVDRDGMRTPRHLAENVAAAGAGSLPADLLPALRAHRSDRPPSRASMS